MVLIFYKIQYFNPKIWIFLTKINQPVRNKECKQIWDPSHPENMQKE